MKYSVFFPAKMRLFLYTFLGGRGVKNVGVNIFESRCEKICSLEFRREVVTRRKRKIETSDGIKFFFLQTT